MHPSINLNYNHSISLKYELFDKKIPAVKVAERYMQPIPELIP